MGNSQRYTPITLYTKAPLYNIIIIVDADFGRNEISNTKTIKSTISPYCHFGMHDQGLLAARLTCAAYVDGKKR